MNWKRNSSKILLMIFTFAILSVFFPNNVWADEGNIFTKISSKAATALLDMRGLIYVLGGFGLIGFAFMAIFNKLSWNWFANLSIGLFLVAVMGMLISYFTGDESIAKKLDFGYDMGRNTSNPGSSGGQEQIDCRKYPENCPGGYKFCPEGKVWTQGRCV